MTTLGPAGYWPSPWPGEDGGPARLQSPHGRPGLGLGTGEHLEVTTRQVLAATMVVLRDEGEAYLLCHTAGDDAISWVERFEPTTLEVLERSPDLPGGPTWPGGLAAHANGSLYAVFGRHAHRLAPDTTLVTSRTLPRNRPYNSFVILPDGHLVTKDFGGVLPDTVTDHDPIGPTEVLVLEPEGLEIVARLELPEPSVARLSAEGDRVVVVGDTTVWSLHWDGTSLALDPVHATYRTLPGQTYGWDAVLHEGIAWFLDNGEGTQAYAGSFRGVGTSPSPLHLVRADLHTGSVTLTEVSGLPGGIVANPPALDPGRRMVVAYDSGNGVVVGFRYDVDGSTEVVWRRALDHGGHPIVFPDTGEVVLGHHDQTTMAEHVVVLDIESGTERGRVATGSPLQSVVFPAVGFGRDLYACTFMTLSRVAVAASEPSDGA